MRRKVVKKISSPKIDQEKQIINSLKIDELEIKSKLDDQIRGVEDAKKELKKVNSEIKEANNLLKEKQVELEDYSNSIKDLQEKKRQVLKQYKKSSEKLDNKEQLVEAMKDELNGFKFKEINSIKKEIEGYKHTKYLLSKDIQDLLIEKEECILMIQQFKRKLKDIKGKRNSEHRELNKVSGELIKCENLLAKLVSKEKNLSKELVKLEKKKEDLKPITEKYDRILKEIEKEKNQLNKIQEKREIEEERLNDKIELNQELLERLEVKLKKVKNLIKDNKLQSHFSKLNI